MKTINRICQILAIVFGLASLVLFFTHFATIVAGENSVDFVGAELAFGAKKAYAGSEIKMDKSADILFCFFLTAIGFILSVFSFKSKGLRYTAPAFALGSGIYLLVMALSDPRRFVDTQPITGVTDVVYGKAVWLLTIALLVFAAFAIAYLFIDDYIEVKASKGAKRTILARVIAFFRDYKGEVKKIVWPGFRDVLKNTLIVLIMCLLVGILIWAEDFGLGKLLELILGA